MPQPVNLHRRIWEANGPTVILLHGLTGCASLWEPVALALQQAGYRTVAPDLRGHGESPKPGGYTIPEHVADVTALLQVTGPAHLVGHSIGATIAWQIAGARPELVRSLVIEDKSPTELPHRARGWREWAANWPRKFASREEALDFLAAAGRTAVWWEHSLTKEPDGSWGWSFDPDGVVAASHDLNRLDRWDEIAAIAVPTLIIRGERSPVLKAPEADRMAAAIPGSRVVAIPGADHWVNREAGPYSQALIDFLASVSE